MIAPNKDNKGDSGHPLPTTLKDGKEFVLWNQKYVEILGLIHTHPDMNGIQENSPGVDFQLGFAGIHNYVMANFALFDGYLVDGKEKVDELGRRNAYDKLPAHFFGFP